MSKIKLFLEQLKADLTVEAFQTVKDELAERARTVTAEIHEAVASDFKFKKIEEKKDETDDKKKKDADDKTDDDSKDSKDDDNKSDEEKESDKGDEEADMDKKDK